MLPLLAYWPVSEQTASRWLDTLSQCPAKQSQFILIHINILAKLNLLNNVWFLLALK